MNLSLIPAVVIVLLSGVGAILLGVGGNQAYAWLPSVDRAITRTGPNRIKDRNLRERAQEEWQAVIDEIPGFFWRVVHALSLFISAKRVEEDWLLEASGSYPIEWTDLENAAKQFCLKLRDARIRAG